MKSLKSEHLWHALRGRARRVRWRRLAVWAGVIAAVCAVVLLVPSDAWAEIAGAESKIEAKFKDIQSIARKVAWGIFGVGAIVIGVKLNNGDPDVRTRLWQFMFGGLFVYLAPDVVLWLQQ